MADLSVQEQILIELKRQNALLEEQLRPQREADAYKKRQEKIRQSSEYIELQERYNYIRKRMSAEPRYAEQLRKHALAIDDKMKKMLK